MRYVSLIDCLLVLAACMFAAGCVTDSPDSPDTPPFAGDPVVGVWVGSFEQTYPADGSNELTTVSTDYSITVTESGVGTVAYEYEETTGSSSTSGSVSVAASVSKADNVYTITPVLEGTYVLTVSSANTAVLKTPNGHEIPLDKV